MDFTARMSTANFKVGNFILFIHVYILHELADQIFSHVIAKSLNFPCFISF